MILGIAQYHPQHGGQMKLAWLRLGLLAAVLFCTLGSWFRILSVLRPFDGQWGWVGVMLCADVSAILAMGSILRKMSLLRTSLDGAALLLSLVGHYVAFLFCTFPDGLNPLWVAASSAGVAFGALIVAMGYKLAQRKMRKPAIPSRYAAINRYRQVGPATAFLVAALACLPLVSPIFAFIDHVMWAGLPFDPWRGGDLVGGEQATRFMMLHSAFLICGSFFNLVSCGILSIYHGRMWRGASGAILLSTAVLLGAVPMLRLAEGARKFLGDWPWQMAHALFGLGWILVPVIFLFQLITHYRLASNRA